MIHYGIKFKIRMPDSHPQGGIDRYILQVLSKESALEEIDIKASEKELTDMGISVIECYKQRELTKEEWDIVSNGGGIVL